jgi:hypothetical protein
MKHSVMLATLAAMGFALLPVAAGAQATDQPATTSPYASATANPMASPGAMETATAPPAYQTTTTSSSTTSGPWGLIGLIGLLGLIGLRGGARTTTTRDL